jgi:hypothetical protein
MLPSVPYSIKLTRNRTLSTFPIPDGFKETPQPTTNKSKIPLCLNLHALIDQIRASKTESDVPYLLNLINTAVTTIEKEGKQAECISELALVSVVKKSSHYQKSIKISNNESVTIEISRSGITRTIILKGKEKKWLTHVGLGFFDNKDKSYFSKQSITGTNPEVTSYILTKKKDSSDFDYSALALFTYPVELGYVFDGSGWGVTAGLGATKEKPVAMLGISGILDYQFIVTAGFIIQEYTTLKGEFNDNQLLGDTPIDSSNLVENTYKPSFGIVLGFSFD